MSLFIAEDGSALEKLCLLPDGVEASAWLGRYLKVGFSLWWRWRWRCDTCSIHISGW